MKNGSTSICRRFAAEDQSIPIGPKKVHGWQEGDVLHPERESKIHLDKIAQEMGSYAFAAQYLQQPAPLGGGIIKWEWFKDYTLAKPPPLRRR